MIKTYKLGSIKRIIRFSDDFDDDSLSELFCGEWLAFNDGGKSVQYVFKQDGSLIIKTDRARKKGKWKWNADNKSLIITEGKNVLEFHPEYWDRNILALSQHGTSILAFLIEKNFKESFHLDTKKDLIEFMIKKEKDEADDKKRKIRENILERQRIAEIMREKNAEKDAINLSKELMPDWYVIDWFYAFLLSVFFTACLDWLFVKKDFSIYVSAFYCFFAFIFFYFICLFAFNAIFRKKAEKEFWENHDDWRHKKHHLNDRKNKYVKFQPNLKRKE